MIGLKADIPDMCVECLVRMDCERYARWLKDYASRESPKPVPGTDECMLVELDGDMEE